MTKKNKNRNLNPANYFPGDLLTENTMRVLVLCLLFTGPALVAQEIPVGDTLQSAEELRSARDLRVLSPTLAPEQIDRAVLNRLMQEILDSPEATAYNLQLTQAQLHDILTLLSNAHGFINDNDLANVQAMCLTWDKSSLVGDAKITEALAAYDRRAQFTKDFIAQYYNVVLANIEAGLSATSLQKFQTYMEDRRRRMASAGAIVGSANSSNARSGAESIRFHCRAQ